MFFHFESENKDSFGLQWLFTMEELKFVIENKGHRALALKQPQFCNNLYLTSYLKSALGNPPLFLIAIEIG